MVEMFVYRGRRNSRRISRLQSEVDRIWEVINPPPGVPPPEQATFSDDFEASWFVQHGFASLFPEDFSIGWFASRPFTSIFLEGFNSQWFTARAFNLIFSENFQNGGW